MLVTLPNHLRPRREKIFGPAPAHRLDGNAKARLWAAASAYNNANRVPRQHQGPLTWASLRVLRALLWRFHNADGGGRCFPSYEKIAAAAKCHRDSVCVALKALEDAQLISWVHRLTRIRRREQDLFGHWGSVWQVIRTSNGYVLRDPLDREPGRRIWCKSENPAQPQNLFKNQEGVRPAGAPVIQREGSPASPQRTEPPAIALQREQAAKGGALLSDAERAALTRKPRHQADRGRTGTSTAAISRQGSSARTQTEA